MPDRSWNTSGDARDNEPDRPGLNYDVGYGGIGIRIMPATGWNTIGGAYPIFDHYTAPDMRCRGLAGGERNATTYLPSQHVPDRPSDDPERGAHAAPGANTARTIEQLSVLYCEEVDPVRKPRTVELYQGYWTNHILPILGSRFASDVQRHEVVRLHRAIGVTNRTTANRVLGLLAHFYRWASVSQFVPGGFNPCSSIEKFKEKGRERYLTNEELGRLGAALSKAESLGITWARESRGQLSKHAPRSPEHRRTRIDPDAADAIRMLLLTGARLREILHLKWADYDRQRGLLLLSDSKTGRKTIVLGQHATATLERVWDRALKAQSSARPRPVSAYVFPTHDPEVPRADLKRPWAMLTREANLPGLRIHDLRHSFASVGVSAQLGLPVIGTLLGHSSTQTTERYAHLATAPLRSATDLISGTIHAALGGQSGDARNEPQDTALPSKYHALARHLLSAAAHQRLAQND